jgi:hypothetical protein
VDADSNENYDIFVMNGDLVIDEVHKPKPVYRPESCLEGEEQGDGIYYDEEGREDKPTPTHYSCTTYKQSCDTDA